MRVAVVGGGVVGLSLAREMRKSDAEVVVVEAARCGEGCSHANAGWVCPALSAPLAAPDVPRQAVAALFRPARSPLSIRPSPRAGSLSWARLFLRSCTPSRFAAGRAAIMQLAAPAPELYDDLRRGGVDFEIHRTGLLVGASSDAALERYAESYSRLTEDGYCGAIETIGTSSLRKVEPAFSESVVGAVHLKSERHLRPETLMHGLLADLRRRGTEIREHTTVVGLHRRGGGWSLTTTKGELVCDRVVIAAGTASAHITRRLGLRVPMQAAKGYSVTSTGSGMSPQHPLYMPDAKVGCSPFGSDLRMVGTFELGANDDTVHRRRVARITDAWSRYLRNWRSSGPRSEWAGLRPMTPDALPLMGEVPDADGMYVSTGHGMLGVTLAPASAVAMSAFVVHGEPQASLEPFRLTRFGRE